MHNSNVKALLLIYFQYKHPSCEWKSIFGEGFTLSTMTSNYEWSDDTTSQHHNTTVLRSVRIPILKVTTYK